MKVQSRINLNTLPKGQSYVDNNLIRGGYVVSPVTMYRMKKLGITKVIDLRNTQSVVRRIEQFLCSVFKLKYINKPYAFEKMKKLPDEQDFLCVNKEITENNGKTYLHCVHGKHRTGIFVAMYEREILHKETQEVLGNLLNKGFLDLDNDNHKEINRNLLISFMNKYYPNQI